MKIITAAAVSTVLLTGMAFAESSTDSNTKTPSITGAPTGTMEAAPNDTSMKRTPNDTSMKSTPNDMTTTKAMDASTKTLATVPSGVTVTDYYKQDVYDPSNNKIGTVEDVLVDENGQITALILGVGGFLGIGQKDVATPFQAVKQTQKDNKMYLVMNATKDELKAAPGFKYDRTTTRWVPDTANRS